MSLENYHYLNVYDRYVFRGLYARVPVRLKHLLLALHTEILLCGSHNSMECFQGWGLETDKNPPMQRRKEAQFQFQGKTASAFHLLDRLALLSVRGIKRKRKDGYVNKRYRLESEACHLFPSLFVLEEILNQVQAKKKKIMNPALASGACMHSGSRLLIWIDGTHSKDVFLQNTPDWQILTMVKKHG